jgi:hypothetical protein
MPHHVTRCGNRRLDEFYSDENYPLYLGLLSEQCRKTSAGRKSGTGISANYNQRLQNSVQKREKQRDF